MKGELGAHVESEAKEQESRKWILISLLSFAVMSFEVLSPILCSELYSAYHYPQSISKHRLNRQARAPTHCRRAADLGAAQSIACDFSLAHRQAQIVVNFAGGKYLELMRAEQGGETRLAKDDKLKGERAEFRSWAESDEEVRDGRKADESQHRLCRS